MSRLSRATQKIFGTGGNVGTGGFGAAAAGNTATELATSSSLSTLQGLAAWTGGWISAVLGASKFPALEDMNALAYVTTTQLSYLLAQGIPEYDSGTTYYTNQVCMKAGTFQLYGSLTDSNLGNALTSAANWKLLMDFTTRRTPLTANTSFFVATTGNDSTGDGSVGSPWLTIQHAVNYLLSSVDLAGFTATISVANGTYTGTVTISAPFVGGGAVIIQGNTTTPANCIISPASGACISIVNGAAVSMQGFDLASAAGNDAVVAQLDGVINFIGNMTFGTCGKSQLAAIEGGHIELSASYTVSGGATTSHWRSETGGSIRIPGAPTATLTGTPAFGNFAQADGGFIYCAGVAFSGSATGARYLAENNGVINTGGGGATFFPGNSSGSSNNGGVYV